MCMPSGTRHASTHTVQVPSFRAPAPIGAGSGSAYSTVAQSIPSAPMMCVPRVTVPERAAAPPELRKVTVTFSHQRRAVAARRGSLALSSAGPGVAVGPPAPPEGDDEGEGEGVTGGGGGLALLEGVPAAGCPGPTAR